MDNLVSQNSWLSLYGPVTTVTAFVSDHDCIISDHAIRLKLGIKYCSKAISLNKQIIENKTNRNLACIIFFTMCIYLRTCVIMASLLYFI